MQMTLRWFGAGYDSVTLEQIRQVPGVTGIITTLYGTMPGEVWDGEAILALKGEAEKAGLNVAGIESVNIHDAVKTGAGDRDRYIDNYITTLERLGAADIHLVCYNFMPVFDWTRTDLAKLRTDGSTTMAYDQEILNSVDPDKMALRVTGQSEGYVLPGWEPERLGRLRQLFELYREIDGEKLLLNLGYFIKRIMPVCEKYNIRMAIHPDDPAWPVFGLPRIVTGKEQLLRIIALEDNPLHGVTLCTGSLGTNPDNDIPGIIAALKGRIHFAHLRNLRRHSPGKFEEAAHLSRDGSMDMFAVVKALYDSGFDGPVRPDHGRAIWGEKAIPGYGLYDRALGACYLQGLWEAVEKTASRASSKNTPGDSRAPH